MRARTYKCALAHAILACTHTHVHVHKRLLAHQKYAQEDEKLRALVAEYGQKKWSLIASKLQTKGSKQVRVMSGVLLLEYRIATPALLLTSLNVAHSFLLVHARTCICSFTQARRRWKNYLNADNKQGGWSAEVGCCHVQSSL